MDLAYERSDWQPTEAAEALLRNNLPRSVTSPAALGRSPARIICFTPVSPFEKQLIVINNSREPMTCDFTWSLGLPQPIVGQGSVTVGPRTADENSADTATAGCVVAGYV